MEENKNLEENETSEKNVGEEKTSGTNEDKEPDYKAKADAFYAKLKDREEELEALKAKLNKPEKKKPSYEGLSVEKVIEVSSAITGLDSKEQERLMTEAKNKGISLSEAKKDEDFLLWKKAHREKVELENKQLKPSTKQSEAQQPKSLNTMSDDERTNFLMEKGWYKPKMGGKKAWQRK